MAKINSPVRLSDAYNLDRRDLARLGVFDPCLAADTPLFIDPLLLRHSQIGAIARGAAARMDQFFADLFTLVRGSQQEGDLLWRQAVGRLTTHEVKGTCLGYGAGNISGSGWDAATARGIIANAKQIIQAGVEDHNVFQLVGMFQGGVGPDGISDMTTNVILPELIQLTQQVCAELNIAMTNHRIGQQTVLLPSNPTQSRPTPVVLVPADCLRELPVALSFQDIWDAAIQNDELRENVNAHIGAVWIKVTKEQKSDLLGAMLRDQQYAAALIRQVVATRPANYNVAADNAWLHSWADLAQTVAVENPFQIDTPQRHTVETLNAVVVAIIEQFQVLVERRGLWRILQDSPERKKERTAQMLFFAIAWAYCRANSVGVTPEADTGSGPVDFRFDDGVSPRILVELKLSKNRVLHGYEVQLPTYMHTDQADEGHYVVIDVGSMGSKWTAVQEARRNKLDQGLYASAVWLVDSMPQASASRR